MLLSLVYLALRFVLQPLVLSLRSEEFEELELVVLRHELAVVRRQGGRPHVRPADRASLAAASRLLRRARWRSFCVTPARSFAGIATSCADARPIRVDAPADRSWQRMSANSGCASHARTRAGAISGSSASSAASASRLRHQRPHDPAPGRAGAGERARRPLLARVSRDARPDDDRLRLLHGRRALARQALRALLDRARRPPRPPRRLHRRPGRRMGGPASSHSLLVTPTRSNTARLPDPRSGHQVHPGLDEILRTEGLQIIRTPSRAPKANAVAERFVRTVRVECLDWLPIAGANSNVRSARSSATTTPTARTGRSASHPGSRIERRSALPTRTPISVCEDAIGSAARSTNTAWPHDRSGFRTPHATGDLLTRG